MKIELDLKSDNSEYVHYDSADFPVYVRKNILSYYPNYAASSHYHDDIEFIYILSGHMQYNINGQTVMLETGNGLFVNSRQLHYGYSDDKTECEFICILLHPLLLCATDSIQQSFIIPVINSSYAYIELFKDIDWQNDILSALYDMYLNKGSYAYILTVQSLFYKIWSILFDHILINNINVNKPSYDSHHLTALKKMIGYIQTHYNEKITLDDICTIGNVCKSSCCKIFQSYLHQTPMSYLTDYRLNRSIELLQTTSMNITEICLTVGFSGASYFTETFRKYFSCSPTEYRKMVKNTAGISI